MLNERFSLPLDPCNKMKSVKFEELLGFIFIQGLLGVHTEQHKTVCTRMLSQEFLQNKLLAQLHLVAFLASDL